MKKIADYLTNYISKKGIISEEDYSIYNYGFQLGLELCFCLCICSIIACLMDAFYESIILWAIFFYIRSYAGGVHLKKYRHCLVCSCTVYSTLLVLNRFKPLNCVTSLCLCCLCTLTILICASMQTNNIDKKEQSYFRSVLIKRQLLIIVVSLAFFICKCTVTLSMIAYSLSGIAISAILQNYINLYKNCMRSEG